MKCICYEVTLYKIQSRAKVFGFTNHLIYMLVSSYSCDWLQPTQLAIYAVAYFFCSVFVNWSGVSGCFRIRSSSLKESWGQGHLEW